MAKGPGGRPSKYKPEYCQMVDDYLAQEQDTTRIVTKGNGVEEKLEVKLPTYDGFSTYIDVPLRTLHRWAKDYPEFGHSLRKIKAEQKKRLINKGLSGDYSNPIAKLILSHNHGMSEKQEHKVDMEVSGNIDLSGLSPIELEEIRKKLLD